jgi:hypothetical protein
MPEPIVARKDHRAQAEAIDARWPFGPLFFVSQLRGFIRDRCPEPNALPELELHLADGQALDVCHVVAIAPAWIALAVYECSSARDRRKMRTDFVPYGMIARITISADRAGGSQLGFDMDHQPTIAVRDEEIGRSAEQALLSARCHSHG